MATIGAVQNRRNNAKPMEWVPPHELKTTMADLTYIRNKLKSATPQNFSLHTPIPDEDFHKLPDNRMVFWRKQIEAGLRLPPPPFLRDLANLYKIPLNQIHPSAIRRAITFHILVYHSGYDNTVDLFFQTNSIRQNNHFYFFTARPKTDLQFLQKPPSVDGHFQDRPFILEIENDTLKNRFGLRYTRLHKSPYLLKQTTPPTISREAKMVLAHLNFAANQHQAKMVELVTNNSLLASSDLFPNFPKTEIEDSWFELVVQSLGGRRDKTLFVSPAATTEEREKTPPTAPGSSSSLSRILSEVELETTAETHANTSLPPSGADPERPPPEVVQLEVREEVREEN